MVTGGRILGIGIVAVVGAALALSGAASATAVPAGTIGTFPAWTVAGAGGAYTGTAAFASPTLASPSMTSDSVQITPASGGSAYLGAGTDFGTEFGTTRAQPYVTIRPQSASPISPTNPIGSVGDSTTTIDFGATPPQAGWGFALGDIDADWVQVRGYTSTGTEVPIGDLGVRTVDNYCDSSPKPSSCPSGGGPFDIPNWTGTAADTPETYTTGTIHYAAQTVYGNFDDTAGGYIWFTPTSNVRRITLLYGAINGSPVYQLWLAQPAPVATITGTVTPGGGTIPAGTTVQLDAADGTPIAGLDGAPVTAPVSTADGSYSFTTEQRTAYELQVLPPAGYTTPAPVTVPAEATAVTAPALELDPAAPSAGSAAPTLAASGIDPLPALAAALLALVVGVGLLRARRRH